MRLLDLSTLVRLGLVVSFAVAPLAGCTAAIGEDAEEELGGAD